MTENQQHVRNALGEDHNLQERILDNGNTELKIVSKKHWIDIKRMISDVEIKQAVADPYIENINLMIIDIFRFQAKQSLKT